MGLLATEHGRAAYLADSMAYCTASSCIVSNPFVAGMQNTTVDPGR